MTRRGLAAALIGTVLVISCLAAACSPVTLLNLVAPRGAALSQHSYGAGPRHMLDVYAPAAAGSHASAAAGAPVVVFFYGGGWESGNRRMYRFIGATLAAHGIVAVIPDYRVYPEVRFPDFIKDGAAAVAWAEAHAAEYGGDPARLFLMGHSAGAQIAALLALDRHYLREAKADPENIAGVIGLAGPYDFLPLKSERLRDIFGTTDTDRHSQPIDYVTADAPPMLLASASDDVTVYPRNSRALAARLRAAGRRVTELYYPHVGHRTLIAAFAGPLSFLAPVQRDTLRFIARTPGGGG